MDKKSKRLAFLLLLVILAFSVSLYFFFGEIVETFNQNKYVVFGGWMVGVVSGLVGIFSLLAQNKPDPQRLQAEEKRRKRAELLCLLEGVEKVWITDTLQGSLHEMVLLQLDKESQPRQVEHPLNFRVELPNQENHPLPPKTTITQVFNKQAARHLLILGEPGSGKTTSLLELTRDLLKEARRDESKPIPVVFTLSSWQEKQLPLLDWMAFELFAIYQIPRAIGAGWLRGHLILPLLDGLDEVGEDKRGACAQAINGFAQEAGLTGLVVACRKKEYEELAPAIKLRLNAAVNLLPLRPVQIEQYLAAGGKAWAGLRGLLKEDAELQTLAQSPLFLSIMALAYHGLSLADIKASADGGLDKRGELFERYIAKMFERRKGEAPPYPKAQVLAGLAWLAKHMRQRGQTVFLLEYLQPDWLPGRVGYRGLTGLVYGGFFYAMLYAANPMARLALGLFVAVIFCLTSGTITPVEKLAWSWDKLKRFGWRGSLFVFILAALIIGSIFAIGNFFQGVALLSDWPLAMTAGFVASLAVIAHQGFDNKIPATRIHVNQGILASGKNVLRYGLPFGLLVGVAFWLGLLGTGYAAMSFASVSGSLFIGLFGGVMLFGAWAVIQHYLLRLLLALERRTPMQYARFLDYAARLILLRKVGGGYQFIHRLLLEHFAERDASKTRE